MNFAARAAGAGIAHGPEIFLQAGDGNHVFTRRADAYPQVARLFVDAEDCSGRDFGAAKHGERQPVDGNSKPIGRGDEFPGVGDGVSLEIIAEGKISEHLKERVMAVGEADVFQVIVLAAGAHAFLGCCGARVFALIEAQENVLELVHSGVGEEQRGIVRGDERGAAHHAVAALGEEFQERAADFVAARQGSLWSCFAICDSKFVTRGKPFEPGTPLFFSGREFSENTFAPANHYGRRVAGPQRGGGAIGGKSF